MKRTMYYLISTLVALSFILTACATPATPTAAPAAPAATTAPAAPAATTAPAASQLAVGIVLPTKDEPRWIQDQTRFQTALQAAGYQVEILFSQGDSAKEKANVESLISKNIKVLIICPQDAAAAGAAADEAHAAGIKVISYDRLITGSSSVDYYVTFDSISVGKAQGQYLVDHATGTGNPLYLYAGAATDNNAFLFFEGAWEVLQPKVADGTFVIKNSAQAVSLQSNATLTHDQESQIIGQTTTNWDFNTAKNLAESNLTATTAADKGNVFILAPNDGTARSIADAFAADKDVKSYVITGQDAEVASVQYIIDGKQSMTVFKDVRTLVKDAISTAVSILQGQTPKTTATYNNGKIDVPAIQSPVIVVDKSNVQSALIDSGYYQASQFTGLGAAPAATTAPAAPTAALSSTSGANTKVCLVTDVGGINDKSFNATAWKGVTEAQTDYGITSQYLQSKQQTDYAKNIQAYIDAKCNLIVTVGFLLGDATAAAAKANPTMDFSIVDNAYDPPVSNIRALTFSTDQAAFLAGYLAAGMSKSGKIGTFGGLQIPTVTIFEDGFYAGAMYYNKIHSTSVQVLGWDPVKKTGLFAGGFNDQTQGKNLANNLMQEGADIIMPVAGAVGLGAAAAVQAANNGTLVIGVDTDWTISAADYTPITLTSVMKNMDVAVHDTIAAVIAGKFQGGNYVGTLANNGVQIAPFHSLDSKVPDALKTELTQLKADIISGKVSVAPVAQ